ncbi:kinesin-like protein KIF3A isoform X2 [Anthonomus grandis grandis]|nr:kinesin-like protein KIF3A isoform X2 [Anthonomus grandis grandis]
MTGSARKYEDRGIIPRCLQSIFASIEKSEEKPTLYVSYMEIYNEICYDLLATKNCSKMLEELPRVIILEDGKGEAHLRNLNVLPVSTEEEAMRLLFLGNTNRAVAETPLNEYSSRSHCIFTIYVSSRPSESKSLVYSKLNLVDLAGSERVYKSHITGSTLNEAKQINLSLHFLQQVILALSESRRIHIPYRNSLMTFILKDSLAGNCLTVMLATLNVSNQNLQETISTCKFAQRVSLLKTDPIINEVIDPYQEILILKNELQELRRQMVLKQSESRSLSKADKSIISVKLDEFLANQKSFKQLQLEPFSTEYCLDVFKMKIHELQEALKIKKEHELENIRADFSDESTYSVKESVLNEEKDREVDYYLKRLSCAYEKAKILAATIDECQVQITYIREKLDGNNEFHSQKRRNILYEELERQQNVYAKSLEQLKEIKKETLQLEGGLAEAKTRINIKTYEKEMYSIKSPKNCSMEKAYDCIKTLSQGCKYDKCGHRYISPKFHVCNTFEQESSHCTNMCADARNCQNQFIQIEKRCISCNPHGFYNSHYNPQNFQYPVHDQCGYQIQNVPLKVQNYDTSLIPSDYIKQKHPAKYLFNTVQCCSSRSSFAYKESQDTVTSLANNQTHLANDLPDQSDECCEIQLVPNKLDKSKDRFDECCLEYSPRRQECALSQINMVQEKCYDNYQSAVVIYPPEEEYQIETKKYNIFNDSDSDEFRKFMATVSLTGDEEIDREICNFYRTRVV